MNATELPRQKQIKDFLGRTAFADAALEPLTGDASFRRYIRVRNGTQVAMLMDAPPEKEDVRPYLAVARYFYDRGYSVPAVLASDDAQGFLLLEDLGDDSFTLLLKHAGVATRDALEFELYAAAIDLLVKWHNERRSLADAALLPLQSYSHALLMKEVRLFSDWYLPQAVGMKDAAALGAEYAGLWEGILKNAPLATDCWVHRDFHADNLMWLPQRAGVQRVGLLDFQDGVYGDAAYDLVSLLEDARRDVPPALVDAMIARFLAATGLERERFMAAYAILGAQRNSKIVGIFVRLAARDNKHHYTHLLPRVWRHLERDCTHPALAPVKQWMDRHIARDWRGSVEVKYTARDLALSA